MSSELNIECFEELLAYLRATGRIDPATCPAFSRLEGGVSNRTVLVQPENGAPFVLKQALARLRVATEWRSDPRRIEREALGMRWLERLAPPGTITRLLFEDLPHHVLAMEAVPLPHENWKTQLLAGRLNLQYVRQFGEMLALIHSRSREMEELRSIFENSSFFESLRLEPYYKFTAAQVPVAANFLEELILETRTNRHALVHGDYSPKNVLVHRDRLVLLDHEVIHFGDPAFDLGFSLAHFLSKANHLPDRQPAYLEAAREYWRTYVATVGDLRQSPGFEPRAARQTLGCLLARVDGRSPLEYLTPGEKHRQRVAVLSLLSDVPDSVLRLVDEFGSRLG